MTKHIYVTRSSFDKANVLKRDFYKIDALLLQLYSTEGCRLLDGEI